MEPALVAIVLLVLAASVIVDGFVQLGAQLWHLAMDRLEVARMAPRNTRELRETSVRTIRYRPLS